MSDNMISTFNRGIPSTFQFYDFSASSFTVAAASTGNTFAIPGSVRSYNLSSAKNVTKVAAASNDRIAALGYAALSALITTTTTDATSIELQYSTNGGSSYTSFTPVATLSAASINRSASYMVTNNIEYVTGNAVTSPILLRSVVFDGTSPTTDALTISDIRVFALLMVMV